MADMSSQDIDEPTRGAIARVANIIHVLAAHFVPLTDTILLEAYEWSVEQEEADKGLFQEDIAEALVASLHSRS